MQQGGTTTSLHLHADAANTGASSSSHTSEYVSVPIDLRRLDQATAGPPSSMGVRSVVVTMSPNSERLARDTSSDDVEIAAGHRPLSTGQAVLDDDTDPLDETTDDVAGTHRFANRFTGTARTAEDNYTYLNGIAHGMLCNLGHNQPPSSFGGARLVRYEHSFTAETPVGERPAVYVLKLGRGDDVLYKAYGHAVADGQQVQLDAHNDNVGKTPFVLPSEIANANRVVGGNKEPDTTTTAILYARNVVVPTNVGGEGAKGTRALMFFNTYADATADYDTPLRAAREARDEAARAHATAPTSTSASQLTAAETEVQRLANAMAAKAVDVGPTGFTEEQRAAMGGVSYDDLELDYAASSVSRAKGHVLTILNRSVLDLNKGWWASIGGGGAVGDVAKLQYVGNHPPQPTSSQVLFAKRLDGTPTGTTAGLGAAPAYNGEAQVRVVLFATEAEANKSLSSYEVDTTAADGSDHGRALAYACAKAALRLVQPTRERAGGSVGRNAFAEPLLGDENPRLLSGGVQSMNHIDPSDEGDATLIKLKRPTKFRAGDEVVLEPVMAGANGTQYQFGAASTAYAHALDPAPDGQAQYAAYTGAAITADQIAAAAEGAVVYVGAELEDDAHHLELRLYSSREAAMAKDQRKGVRLNAWRAYAAARSSSEAYTTAGIGGTLLGRLRLVRRRAATTWTCLYAEIGGCSAGSAGVISTDPYVSQTGHHVVAVPRSLANRLYPVDITLPIDAVDRRGHLKLWVVEHDGKRRRPVFPDDLERIDVLVDIYHRRKPLSEAERKQRYQAFVAEVVASWGGSDTASASAGQPLLEPFQGPGSGRRAF